MVTLSRYFLVLKITASVLGGLVAALLLFDSAVITEGGSCRTGWTRIHFGLGRIHVLTSPVAFLLLVAFSAALVTATQLVTCVLEWSSLVTSHPNRGRGSGGSGSPPIAFSEMLLIHMASLTECGLSLVYFLLIAAAAMWSLNDLLMSTSGGGGGLDLDRSWAVLTSASVALAAALTHLVNSFLAYHAWKLFH